MSAPHSHPTSYLSTLPCPASDSAQRLLIVPNFISYRVLLSLACSDVNCDVTRNFEVSAVILVYFGWYVAGGCRVGLTGVIVGATGGGASAVLQGTVAVQF